MQELIALIQEEAELMEPESLAEEAIRNTLYSTAKKISGDGTTTVLTLTEKSAVRRALQDVNENYPFGRKVHEQAAALGISL